MISCADCGAHFLTARGLDCEIISFAAKENIVALPGALTPTEVLTAWRAGADFVKLFPCTQVGGDTYVRALNRSFPQIPLVAAGGDRTPRRLFSPEPLPLGLAHS